MIEEKENKNEEVSVNVPIKSGFTHILFQLAAQGFTHVVITYAGSGDSGCIESTCVYEKDIISEDEHGYMEFRRPEDQYDAKYKCLNADLKTRIEDYVYSNCLDALSDWWNNEGGQGTLFISTANGNYYCDHSTNVTETVQDPSSGTFGD